MKTKEDILADLQEGLNSGILTEADIQQFTHTPQLEIKTATVAIPEDRPEKLSAVDTMFYIAGIVLFSTIMSMIVQSWNDGNPFVHILLSAFLGMTLWLIAYYLIKVRFKMISALAHINCHPSQTG